MPCYYPLDGWRSKKPNENGKYPIVFDRKEAQEDLPLRIACGRCIGCRLEYSRQWAIRCLHEASMYEQNCFLTLTYDDENLPPDGDLNHADFQNFMKKIRNTFIPENPHPKGTELWQEFHEQYWIRYYMCGEYGEPAEWDEWNSLGRPHYHALLFNFNFDDREHMFTSDSGSKVYTSETLTKLWGLGHATIGEVTFDSAAYVARYCTKKITGDGDSMRGIPSAADHYTRVCLDTGIESPLTPEYVTMSRRPGIAKPWFDKFQQDLQKDFVTVDGVIHGTPKYYDHLLKEYDEIIWSFIEQKRKDSIDSLDPEYGTERLRVKELIKLNKLNQIPRNSL